MFLATITIRDAAFNPIPGASIATKTTKYTTDGLGRAMVLMQPGDVITAEVRGYRKTSAVITDKHQDVVLLPEKLAIKGKPDRRDRKAWLLLPLAAGLSSLLLRGRHEHDAIDVVRRRNQRRTGAVATGKMNLGDWQREMASDLAALYAHLALLACPSPDEAMRLAEGFPSSRGVSVPPGWHFSMNQLYDFAHDLATNKTTNMMARSEMYADSGHGVYEKVAMDSLPNEEGFRWEVRNQLGDSEHCPDCLRFARKGWVPKGSIPPPGVGRRCKTHCRCTIQARRVAAKTRISA